MNDFFKPDWFGSLETNHRIPPVNIQENENDFLLELEIPGLKKEDFNIELDNDVLIISSEVKKGSEEKNENYTRKEFTVSSFRRAFTLPETVDSDEINAAYKAGILKISLPKKEEALPKPKRLVEIA